MPDSSRESADHLQEMLLPLDPIPPAPVTPERSRERPARDGERPPWKPRPQQLSPEAGAEEAIRQLQLRQGDLTEGWGAAVDLLSRQLQAEVARLAERSDRTTAELRSAQDGIETTVTKLIEALAELMSEVKATVEAQTTALRDTIASQGETMAAATREAAANIALARHELALSVAELKRRTFRHAIGLGAGMAIVMLLAARILFPFWGMQRPDVEAWNRGTRLLEAYEAATPAQQAALLRTLGWQRMPGALPTTSSTSSARRVDGR